MCLLQAEGSAMLGGGVGNEPHVAQDSALGAGRFLKGKAFFPITTLLLPVT